MEGENDPNFTQAAFVQLTTSMDGANALVDVGRAIVPDGLVLYANYPNPFNPSTTIRFDVPQSGLVNLTIYDLNGRRIATLVDENMAAGSHQVSWNGRDASGISVASGVYIYRLQQMDVN
jgi:flagellar hook assembly protein FlgD